MDIRELRRRGVSLGIFMSMIASANAALMSGANFLAIDPGARPASMAGAFTSASGDLNSIYFNPAGLSGFNRETLGATHAQYLGGAQYDFISLAQPTAIGAFGLAVTRLATQVSEARDDNRQTVGGFSNVDTAYTLGFSRPLSGTGLAFLDAGVTSVGVNAKYIDSRIDSYEASAVAFDLGMLHQMDSMPLSFGLSIQNIGQPMKFLEQADPLPLTVALGTSYRVGGALTIAADVSRDVYNQTLDVRVGCEYALLSNFALRLGHDSQMGQLNAPGAGLAALLGLGAGFGLNLGRYNVDYGFSPFGNELGNIQRISVGAQFGKEKETVVKPSKGSSGLWPSIMHHEDTVSLENRQ